MSPLLRDSLRKLSGMVNASVCWNPLHSDPDMETRDLGLAFVLEGAQRFPRVFEHPDNFNFVVDILRRLSGRDGWTCACSSHMTALRPLPNNFPPPSQRWSSWILHRTTQSAALETNSCRQFDTFAGWSSELCRGTVAPEGLGTQG